MNFNELVQDVMSRLNLSSDEARTRVGEKINDRYRRITSSIGLVTSRRQVETLTLDPVTDTDLPNVIITGMEKVLRVVQPIGTNLRRLGIMSFDDISNMPTLRQNPHAFAIKTMGPGEVTITLDAYPEEEFDLTVEGYDVADVLSGSLEPFLPTDFHYILVQGAMSDELMKMEKPQLASLAEAKYEGGMSDLRMFIARNAYQDIVQGINKPSVLWYRPWFSRHTIN
jgi:hypothetical protein